MVSTDFRSVETTKYILYIRWLKYIAYRKCPKKEEERTAIYYAYIKQIQNLPTLTLHSYTNIQYQKIICFEKVLSFHP